MKIFHIDNTNAHDIMKYSESSIIELNKMNTINTTTRRLRYGIMQREICMLKVSY